MTKPANERLLRPGQVADLFHVDAKTVRRWAKAGRLNAIRTVGGHRRFREAEVRELLQRLSQPAKTVTLPAPERITDRPKIRT